LITPGYRDGVDGGGQWNSNERRVVRMQRCQMIGLFITSCMTSEALNRQSRIWRMSANVIPRLNFPARKVENSIDYVRILT